MIKLAAKTFDVYDDADMSIARKLAATLGSAIGAVKVAERDTVEALNDNQFGLVMKTAGGILRRRFPVHDADAVKLSRAYAEETSATLPNELRVLLSVKLAAAEQLHGIQDHKMDAKFVTEVMDKVAYVDVETVRPERKHASYENQVWGLTIDGKNYFPLHDAVLTKTAAERFPFTASELRPHEKFEYARAIHKQAEALKVELPDTSPIHNYTSDDINVDSLKLALDARKSIMKAAGVATEIIDQLILASGCLPDRGDIERDASWNQRIAKLAAIQRLPADRIVATIQGIDKLAGFTEAHYNSGLADPFAACFKRANAIPATVVEGVDLSKISPDRLAATFDPSFVQEFSSNPVQVYTSLPDPVKAMVRSLAEEACPLSLLALPSSPPLARSLEASLLTAWLRVHQWRRQHDLVK
jgi:hypothetical protein